jgi:hypothetical protein
LSSGLAWFLGTGLALLFAGALNILRCGEPQMTLPGRVLVAAANTALTFFVAIFLPMLWSLGALQALLVAALTVACLAGSLLGLRRDLRA